MTALNGIVIGQAERATRAVLDRLLERVGTPFEQWVALNLTGTGAAVPAAELAARLGVPVPAAAAVLAALEADGLLAPAGLTPAGRARHAEITAGIAAITARLYADLPAEDQETTARVLTLVTTRAHAELATY